MINKLKILVLLSGFVIFGQVSCGDSFIDVESFNEDSENFFNSEEDYEAAMIGAYDMLQSSYINVMLGEIASDNTLAGGESATDVLGIQEIDDMIHTPVNQQLRDIWGWMFAGVNRANYVLEFQDKTDFAGKSVLLAEARFLRAYYYFELVKWFGDVPLAVDKRLLFGDQNTIDRTPKAQVYAQIESDLIDAAATLSYTTTQVGRVTKGAAQALLGKAYLYQNKFTDAANVFDDLIANGPYDLVDDYSTIFENDNENNIESVFEVQYTDIEGAGFGCLQCSEGNVAVGFNGIRNHTGPTFDSGFSFNVPTDALYQSYTTNDVRRDVAILDIEAWAASTGATYAEGYEHTGYYNRKYIARKGDRNTGDQNLTNPNNYRSIRFADVLLMAAEAHNKKGMSDDDQAKIYLNRVRTRAMLGDITSSDDQLSAAIMQERQWELAGEGHRFFDLVRTGNAAGTIPGFQVGKHEVFPIPSIEIELAGNRWAQNPGY